jgi:uncharacterized protein (TIGR02246 family)
MKRSFVTFPLFLLLTSTFAFAQAAGTKAGLPGREQDENGIKQVLASSAEAWNRHDAKAFSMVFAEDADFTNVVGMSAHGRTEIEKFHAPMFATRFKDTHLTITDVKTRFITPDVAAVDARWEMTGAKGPDGQDIPLRKGLLNFVMTRSSGQWLITVMHNMDLAPR